MSSVVRIIRRSSVFLAVLVALMVSQSWAVEENWKLVTRVTGTVSSQKRGESNWSKIFASRLLLDGDRAKTEAESVGNIRLADESVFKIGPSSVVEVAKFRMDDKQRTVEVKIHQGKVLAHVSKTKGKVTSNFTLSSPTAVMAARGTIIGMDVLDAIGSTVCKCYFGSANVTGAGVTQTITTGMMALSVPGIPPVVVPRDSVIVVRPGALPTVEKQSDVKAAAPKAPAAGGDKGKPKTSSGTPPAGGETPAGTTPPAGGETPAGTTPPAGGETPAGTPPAGGETPAGTTPPAGGERPAGGTTPPAGGETPAGTAPPGGGTRPAPGVEVFGAPPPGGAPLPPTGPAVYVDTWAPTEYINAVKIDSFGTLTMTSTGNVATTSSAPPPPATTTAIAPTTTTTTTDGTTTTTTTTDVTGTMTTTAPVFTPVILNPTVASGSKLTITIK